VGNRLPFETHWAQGEQAIQWYQELERLGPDNARIRLAQHDAGSAGSIRGLGREVGMTKGFVEDWLRYRDQQKAGSEERWRWATLIIASIAAAGGLIAAWPVLKSWFGFAP
jgi:hypothetical protein